MLLTLALAAAAAAAAAAPPPTTSVAGVAFDGAQDRAADEAAIRDRASAWGAAFTRGDVSTVENLLAEDFVGTAKDGTLYDKPTMLDWVRAGPNLTSSKTSVSRIRFYNDIAIATGTDDMIGPAPTLKRIKNIWTDVWIRQDGQWRVVAAHDMAGKPD